MSHHQRPRLRLALTLLAALACGSPEPTALASRPTFEGTFVLETVNGSALPVILSESATERYVVLDDSLAFRRDGTVTYSRTVWRQGKPPSAASLIYTNRYVVAYSLEGTHVRFGQLVACGPSAECIGASEGDLTPGGLTVVDHAFWSSAPVLTYRRAPAE